jgi:ATP-dependent Clp protease ATP-binding subunit ClpC
MNPDILQLFTDHVRHVLSTAIDVSYERREEEVEPVILLLCLSMERGSIAAEVLGQNGLTPDSIALMLPDPPDIPPAAFLPVFSEETKSIIEKSAVIALRAQHTHIGTEHILLALLQMQRKDIRKIFEEQEVAESQILSQLDHIFHSTSRLSSLQQMVQKQDSSQTTPMTPSQPPAPQQQTRTTETTTPALDYFAKELTAEEVVELLDPVIGRDAEIDRLIHILSRRTKNNPVLIGEPGVGKTAIVEGLAKRIVEGNVPDALLHKRIYSIDLSSLLAGSMYRGEFESRMKQIIDEVRINRDVIVFIDEVHMLVGAGGVQGSNMDAANILKPALAKGEIRCIGATTYY